MAQLQIDMNINIKFPDNGWQVSPNESHQFLSNIQAAVLDYRIQSVARFHRVIEVAQASSQDIRKTDKLGANFVLWVGFYSFSTVPIFAACRPKSRTQSDGERIPTREIEVYLPKHDIPEQGRYITLRRFLRSTFLTSENLSIGDTAMRQWWAANGKVFDWLGLPNELKERILFFCMRRYPPHNQRNGKARGVPEVTGQFQGWELLGVSRQIRALCLRLCFVGSRDLEYGNGLCIKVKSHFAFKDFMRRAGKAFQLLEPGSLPTPEDKTWELAKTYRNFPLIYPELHRYATLRHGIHKICLQFSFLDSMHFLRVNVGGFAQYFPSYFLDYEIFQRLPSLNELRILLPDTRGRLEDDFRSLGPRLWWGEPFNCPRTLHQLIYERAAEVLAIYDNVKIGGFIDEEEESRFQELRDEARKNLKFTMEELEELYMENGDGIELEESVVGEAVPDFERELVTNAFWPPKCRCSISCKKILRPDTI